MTKMRTAIFGAILAVTAAGAVVYTAAAQNGPQHEQRPASMLSESQQQQVAERKAALHERLAAAKEARKNALQGRRLATCEKRQAKINSVLSRGTDQSRKHLVVFQKIEERVKQFYTNKNLSSEGYEAAASKVDEKQAAAIAAIETSSETTFDCTSTDGAKPGSAIRELMKSRHKALKEYRTAIKDLIVVVKKGHGQPQNTPDTTQGEQ
jgi:hypothetical protein